MSDDPNLAKRCMKCGEIKTLDAFTKNKLRKDGRSSSCKACAALYQQQRRAANPEQDRQYMRDWRAKNLEKVREGSRERHKANPEKRREADRKRYAANPEKFCQSSQAYRKANPEKVRVSKRKWYELNRRPRTEEERERHRKWMRDAYRKNPHRWPKNKEKRWEYSRRYRQENQEVLKEYLRNWQRTHTEHNRARAHRRRVRIKGNGGIFTVQELIAMQIAQAGICAYCRRQYRIIRGR